MLHRRMFVCLCAHIIRFILSYMSGVQSVYNKFLDHARESTLLPALHFHYAEGSFPFLVNSRTSSQNHTGPTGLILIQILTFDIHI